jgi:hypothetical protein
MASKKMKRLGKAAALLAAGYAASKMGSDNTMAVTDTGDMGSEAANKAATDAANAYKPKGSLGPKYGFKKRSIMEDIKGLGKKMLEGPVANEGPVIPDSMMPMANKGMFVTVKTKIGKNKKTKIC